MTVRLAAEATPLDCARDYLELTQKALEILDTALALGWSMLNSSHDESARQAAGEGELAIASAVAAAAHVSAATADARVWQLEGRASREEWLQACECEVRAENLRASAERGRGEVAELRNAIRLVVPACTGEAEVGSC